jgi:hypothetical protein
VFHSDLLVWAETRARKSEGRRSRASETEKARGFHIPVTMAVNDEVMNPTNHLNQRERERERERDRKFVCVCVSMFWLMLMSAFNSEAQLFCLGFFFLALILLYIWKMV